MNNSLNHRVAISSSQLNFLRFAESGGPIHKRPVQDLAFVVARFVTRGSFVNYYMYHGGGNFGRTAGGPFISTNYDYDAPLDEYVMLWHVIACFLFVSNLAFASAKSGLTKTRSQVIIAHHGAVATDDRRCSKIGMDTSHEGGHAMDAAVDAALCLGVVSTASCGMHGGAIMLLRLANGVAKAFDMRETAPLLSSKRIYKWLLEHEQTIKKTYHHKTSDGYQNTIYRVRKRIDEGEWIPVELREKLEQNWDDSKLKDNAEVWSIAHLWVNSDNRAF